jgi:hypothetical protein
MSKSTIGRRRGRPSAPHLPIGPIQAALGARSIGRHDAVSRAWFRAKRSGVATAYQVDRFCVLLLGVHPAGLYGEDWWRAPIGNLDPSRLPFLTTQER